jgi:hypothetical protein
MQYYQRSLLRRTSQLCQMRRMWILISQHRQILGLVVANKEQPNLSRPESMHNE